MTGSVSLPVRAALFLAIAAAGWQGVAFSKNVFIDAAAKQNGDGTKAFPFRSLKDSVVHSGNSYLLRRGRVYDGGIELGGFENVQLGAWGDGPPPLIDGKGEAEYGIRLLSTTNVTVDDLELSNFKGACILVVGSRDYQIRNNHCHDALYGVAVNAGKLGPGGLIEGNRIHRVAGDGIGSWNLAAGVVIRGNHVFEFGNDGIDILGSFGAIVEGNTIHDSVDHPEITRGLGHTGVKAGGNSGAGGGGNVISGNTVYRVKNFGIWNRGAVGNIYRGNTCFENGVNFNFVSSEEPSRAVIENNVARDPTFAAGLRYSVFIPGAADLRSAANNRWHGGLVNVKGSGLVTDLAAYLQIMQPLEQGTQF
jgi:parallel beta-helix repeat protein